jgi:dTDP-glucose 4,6-dehydratase
MSYAQGSDSAHYVPSGPNGVKRKSPPAPCDARHSPTHTLTIPGRRGSTVLNPRSQVKQELWKQAPVLIGSTKFEPLHDAKDILITGGAGFMYVATRPREVVSCASLDRLLHYNND